MQLMFCVIDVFEQVRISKYESVYHSRRAGDEREWPSIVTHVSTVSIQLI